MRPETSATTGDSLVEDLRRSLGAWRVDRGLPFIELLLWASTVLENVPALSLLALPALLFSVGWVGTARIRYLRVFRGGRIEPGETWRFTRGFFWPVVRLGLLVSLASAPFFVPILAFFFRRPSLLIVASAPLWLVEDFALTFVTPAIAFSTTRATQAISLGLRMIRDEWPASAAYVFIPPLAIVLVLRTLPYAAGGRVWSLALGPFAGLVSLAFRGATAVFYLRRYEVGSNGSLEASLPAPPRPDVQASE